MELTNLLASSSFNWYAWVVLPILIFFARVCDVTLGTLRIIFVSRGRRRLAPLLGFVEVLIWIVVIGQLVQHLSSITAYIGYAAGFAAGNYVGMWLEEKLALGTFILRVILPEDSGTLARNLHDAGYGVTCVDGSGSTGPVRLVYTIVKRRHVGQVMSIIHQTEPKAFVTVEEVRSTEKGIFPATMTHHTIAPFGRKSK